MSRTLVVTALRTERIALFRHVAGARLARTGMGPDKARRWAAACDPNGLAGAVITGLGGALLPELRAGDVVVANELHDGVGTLALGGGADLARQLSEAGYRVHVGPIAASAQVVGSAPERRRLAATGAVAVDMESAVVARALTTRLPVCVVRVIVDTPSTPLMRLATIPAGIAALRTLRAIGPVIGRWEGPRFAAS